MPKDEYLKAKDQRGCKNILTKHIEKKDTCEVIYSLAQKMILDYRGLDDLTYEEVEEMIGKMKFR